MELSKKILILIYGRAFSFLISLVIPIALTRLLKRHHNHPEKIIGSKFIALRFQALNGLGLSLGLALSPALGIDLVNQI